MQLRQLPPALPSGGTGLHITQHWNTACFGGCCGPASRFKCACGWCWMKPSSCLAWIFTLITTVEACDKDTTLWDELAGGGGGQETSSKLAQFRWYRTEKIWGSKYAVLTMGFSGREEECHWLTVRVADLSFLNSLPPPKDNGLHLSSSSILLSL